MKTEPAEDLNAWIAEHVMGWRYWSFNANGSKWCQLVAPNEKWPTSNKKAWKSKEHDTKPAHLKIEDKSEMPAYSTNPADAMAVLEKCVEKSCFSIWRDGNWYIHSNTVRANAETLPLAIVQFAKKLYEL